MENRNYGWVEQPRSYRLPPDMQAQLDRKMAEMRAAVRRKHPELFRKPDERQAEES